MEDFEILQHLMSLEKEASNLVFDAQTESDKKIAEGDKQNRSRYESSFAKEIELLENMYRDNLSLIREKYNKQLDDYKESLKSQSVNMQDFSVLAERLLVEK